MDMLDLCLSSEPPNKTRVVRPITAEKATIPVVEHHYLHRAPPISAAFGIYQGAWLVGVVTFGIPASRHMQKSVCPTNPDLCWELNRLWIDDRQPPNTASWFIAQALKMLPPRIIASYADPQHGHTGYVYRASNFHYAGWTDMDRPTPRFDYIPNDPERHSRDAFRGGYTHRQRRIPKVRYWTTTGDRTERKKLTTLCGWPILDWRTAPPPTPPERLENNDDA